MKNVLVWDVPVRLFHWGLVTLLVVMWCSGTRGGDWLAWHIRCGIGLAVLMVFRVLWGLAGSQSARFSDFIKGPAAVLRYLKSGEETTPGHNPLGGWMVLGLLLVLSLQIGTGLFAADVDSYQYDGPLACHLASATAEAVTLWHKRIINVLLALSLLHVTAIVGYRVFKKNNLVLPMLTGRKRLPGHLAAPRIASWKMALACAGLAVLLVLGVVLGWS